MQFQWIYPAKYQICIVLFALPTLHAGDVKRAKERVWTDSSKHQVVF